LETSDPGSDPGAKPWTRPPTGLQAMTVRRAVGLAVALSAVLALVMVGYAKVAPDRSLESSRQAAFREGQEAAQQSAQIQAAVAAAADGAGATVGGPGATVVPEGSDVAIPSLALRAYQNAASWAAGFSPRSHLPWSVVAGIGRLESNHGRFKGSAARFSAAGDVSPEILGPALDGRPGFAAIRDTDGGAWDRDRAWDRAVGPMQFIPSTWRSVGRDGNNDGTANPHNLFDAAMTTAAYLCASSGDLADPAQLRRAVFAYNHSMEYVANVLRWAAFYDQAGPVPGQDPAGSGQPGPGGSGPGGPRVTGTTTGPPTTPSGGPGTSVTVTTPTTVTTLGPSTTAEPTTTASEPPSTSGEAADATSGLAPP
jgi:membrane-bound lytic murein transglycosylase B